MENKHKQQHVHCVANDLEIKHSLNHFLNKVRRAYLAIVKLSNIGKPNNTKLSNSVKGCFLQDNVLSSNTSYSFKKIKDIICLYVGIHVCECVCTFTHVCCSWATAYERRSDYNLEASVLSFCLIKLEIKLKLSILEAGTFTGLAI